MNAVFQQISIKAGNAFRVISVVGEMKNELYRGRPVSPRSPINMIRTVGVITFAIGVSLLCSAFIETYVLAEKLFQVMNGYPSERFIWYIAVGVAATASGGMLALLGTRK